MTPKNIARAVGRLALDKNGLDIKILDLRKLSDVADYFVICSGSVDIHVKAIADSIVDKLKEVRTEVRRHSRVQASTM